MLVGTDLFKDTIINNVESKYVKSCELDIFIIDLDSKSILVIVENISSCLELKPDTKNNDRN